ncbi:MAG: class IV adenylate cyclase [Thermoanaerobaculia bacterium]|nr:class IV adenylate cyclase [Thermoanaerobaculia bacterium]
MTPEETKRSGEGRDRKESSEEREIKFAEVELSALRERLQELEAERVSASSFEDNWVFDRDRTMVENHRLLRLRLNNQGAQLTYKGPPRFEETTKVRVEHQTGVEDPEQTRALLESLGFEVVRRYQKMREIWRLGGVTISLDHTPIGDFVEFEGVGGEKVADRCGLDPSRAERRNYLRLYEDYLEENPDASPDMTFE